jgi:proteasome alpha subunit
MPFYVSPEQSMRDKADYARKGVARSRSSVVVQYSSGILMVTPNLSSVLHKISEIYDRIAFAAVGRYNEYEVLRKAGVTYADLTGYQFDRGDVTARGLANWYAQALGQNFSEPTGKPYEVEIVVAEVGAKPDSDQIYRISWDGSVSDEPGFVAFGGQADQVGAVLKERFSDGMTLTEALGAALDALAAPAAAASGTAAAAANGAQPELTAANLEVAILDRARAHRTFRRLHGPRLEELIAASRTPATTEPPATEAPTEKAATETAEPAGKPSAPPTGKPSAPPAGKPSADKPSAGKPSAPPSDEPPTGPSAPGDGSPLL